MPAPQTVFLSFAMTLTVLAAPPLDAETWFVRVDGGSAEACTGRADAPYSGTGSGQACAWEHPFIALPPGGPARIAGGDTLHIGPGQYMMGWGAPASDTCSRDFSWECHMAVIPSGPSIDQPTRILGAGYDSACPAAPVLWGTERSWMVINLEGSSQVELACLEITDRGSCIEAHCHNGLCAGEVAACARAEPPFGDWAPTGISARDSANVLLRDLYIHGMANRGILAGRLQDWTLERVVISANGWAGWDGNIGPDSANSGTLLFREVEIAFNGCAERWPDGEIFGCWAQGGGGYGDGLGTGKTGGHWVFEDSRIHHNTSDGIDLLYLTDDARVTITGSWLEGNAGNPIKLARAGVIRDSVIIGNCGYFSEHPNMQDADHCRGLGDAVYVGLSGGAQTQLINNVITGQGNCLISSGEGERQSRLVLIGNLLVGGKYWHEPSKQSCLFHAHSRHHVGWQDNIIDQVRNRACPTGNRCGAEAVAEDGRLSLLKIPDQGQLPLHRRSD